MQAVKVVKRVGWVCILGETINCVPQLEGDTLQRRQCRARE